MSVMIVVTIARYKMSNITYIRMTRHKPREYMCENKKFHITSNAYKPKREINAINKYNFNPKTYLDRLWFRFLFLINRLVNRLIK